MTQVFSEDVPEPSVILRQNHAGTGSVLMTVHGANMGLVTCTGRDHTVIVDDGRKERRECDTGMVGRRARSERDTSTEPCRDRVGVRDGTRDEHGT